MGSGFKDCKFGLTIANIFQNENVALLHQIVDELFETGYENGIIADYVACVDVPVLKASC